MHAGRRQLALLRREAAHHRQPRVRRGHGAARAARASGRSSRRSRPPAGREPLVADAWAAAELAELAGAGSSASLEPLASPQGAGGARRSGRCSSSFSSNDYLGLASDPRRWPRPRRRLERWGVATGASRLVVGDTEAHRGSRHGCAAFEDAEAVLLFNGGYSGQRRTAPGAFGTRRRSSSPMRSTTRVWWMAAGCREPGWRCTPLRRRGAGRASLQDGGPPQAGGDGQRSSPWTAMSAPLAELLEVCRAQDAALLVDEAHATGVLGERGAGLCEALGLAREVDVRMGTLGKGLGAFRRLRGVERAGGFPPGEQSPLFRLLHRAACLGVCGAMASLDVLLGRPGPPSTAVAQHPPLRGRASRARPRRASRPPPSSRWCSGSPERAVAAAAFLRARGLLVKPIRPPTVPAGTSRLRFALSAAHTPAAPRAARSLDFWNDARAWTPRRGMSGC